MEWSNRNHSKRLFATLGVTSKILPYYGYAHSCQRLMLRLRKDSYSLWIENYTKWAKLQTIKRADFRIKPWSYEDLHKLLKSNTYFLYHIIIEMPSIYSEDSYEKILNFIDIIDDLKLLSIKILIQNNTIYYVSKEKVNRIFKYLLRLWNTLKQPITWTELTNSNYEGTNIIHLPKIFEVYNWCISLSKALIIDWKMVELPECKTLQELQKTIKNDCSPYLVSTPKAFMEKFVLPKAQFTQNQLNNWKQFVVMDVKQFDSMNQNQMDKWIEYMKNMTFIEKFWLYTDHKILWSRFARKILATTPQINISIVLETAISDNEGSYKFEIERWILTEYDFENRRLKLNDLESWSIIAYSMKHAYLFNDKYVVFPEFEIKSSKVNKIYSHINDTKEDDIVNEYFKFRRDLNDELPESFQSYFGLIIPIDSILSMGFSFSFPYKSEKYYIKQRKQFVRLLKFIESHNKYFFNWN